MNPQIFCQDPWRWGFHTKRGVCFYVKWCRSCRSPWRPAFECLRRLGFKDCSMRADCTSVCWTKAAWRQEYEEDLEGRLYFPSWWCRLQLGTADLFPFAPPRLDANVVYLVDCTTSFTLEVSILQTQHFQHQSHCFFLTVCNNSMRISPSTRNQRKYGRKIKSFFSRGLYS